ncbi:MAG TPA: hypothetical protein VFN61_08185, partial [Acidimicrobiales bacterium]|nr:hypothetical protein [Acidimicrobiales bacterium]
GRVAFCGGKPGRSDVGPGSVSLPDDLQALGLLRAFSLTRQALDIVLWRERYTGGDPGAPVGWSARRLLASRTSRLCR